MKISVLILGSLSSQESLRRFHKQRMLFNDFSTGSSFLHAVTISLEFITVTISLEFIMRHPRLPEVSSTFITLP